MSKTISHAKLTPKLDLGPEDLETLAVDGLGSACTPALEATGWKKLVTGIVGVTMGSDNARILSINFYLLGRLNESPNACTTVLAKKFWPGVKPSLELRFTFLDLNIFKFDSCLQSGLVDSSAINFEVYDPETTETLTVEQFRQAGGGLFCLRAYCHMTTAVYFKLSMVLYPEAKQALLETFPCARNAMFPGLKLLEQESAILPNADKLYGLPFYPFIIKGRRDAPFPEGTSFDLREKIGALLGTGCTPKIARDAEYLSSRWQKLLEKGDKAEDSLTKPSTAAATWPTTQPSPSPHPESRDQEGM